MSFTASTFVEQAQQELTNVGQMVSEADYMLYLNRACKYLMTEYKIPTTEREHDLLLFTGVNEYPLPSDFQSAMEPQRPYSIHSPNFNNTTPRELRHWRHGNTTAIKFIRETPYYVVNYEGGSNIAVHDMNALADNGSWAVSGDGSSLAQDKQIYTEGTASLRFTLTGSGGTTTLTNSTLDQIDITDYVDQGFGFVNLQCPSGNTTAITSVELRLGNDSSNYYSITATTRYRGDTIMGGWGLIGFDFSSKTETGTVTDTEIDYAVIVITNPIDGTVNGTYRVDNLFLAEAVYFQLPYYSLYNVKTTGGAYQESVTSTSDTVLCPVGHEEAFYYKALEIAAAERLKDAGLAQYFSRELEPKERALKAVYPRQNARISTTWYKKANSF